MPAQRRIIIIAKERPFDEEQWKELLTAFAYVLHERRNEHAGGQRHPNGPTDAPKTGEKGSS